MQRTGIAKGGGGLRKGGPREMLKFEMSTPSGLYVHMNILIAIFEISYPEKVFSYPGKVFLDSSSLVSWKGVLG